MIQRDVFAASCAPMTTSHATKRGHESDDETAATHDAASIITSPRTHKVASPVQSGSGGTATAASTFRNVSACNRCRMRKNRCDQRLPACASCEKAHVKCVGYDPITKKEIPRRSVPDHNPLSNCRTFPSGILQQSCTTKVQGSHKWFFLSLTTLHNVLPHQ